MGCVSTVAEIRVMLQLLLIDKKFQEVHPLLNQAGHLVDGWQGSQFQKEYLKVFFLVLQVRSLYAVSTLTLLSLSLSPWLWPASELCRPSDRRFLAK
jgi:hypothetical protein